MLNRTTGVVRAYKIRLTKIGSFGKESIESTRRAFRRVVITACYAPIEAQTRRVWSDCLRTCGS